MTEITRKRSPNWLPSEKELLLSLVELHFNVIENKKTDGVSVRAKLAQWQIIADQYNSRTTHCSRTGENLKAQWESMKKVARKDAAHNRSHNMIQTGDGSPIPPKKNNPFQQRIISLLSTSDIGLLNEFDKDSSITAVQDEAAMATLIKEEPHIEYIDTELLPTTVVVNGPTSETDVVCEIDPLVKKDWRDYKPRMLRTPLSLSLKNTARAKTPQRTCVSRKRPIHTSSSSSLEQLRKKKIEAIDLQTKHAVEEMERAKAQHDIEIQIKKEKLKQEKIKTNILLIRRRQLVAFRKNK